jgi:hypothetical protein
MARGLDYRLTAGVNNISIQLSYFALPLGTAGARPR